MRSLALLLVLASPCLATASVPSSHQARTAAEVHTIRVSLLNLTGHRLQVRLKDGPVDLPLGVRLDLDSRVGATLVILSDTNRSFHEEIRVAQGDDGRIISVR